MDNRATIHCSWCQLNQFQTVSGLCRRCKRLFVDEPESEVTEKPREERSEPLQSVIPSIGIAVRLIRLAKGMTQAILARRMGVFRTFLSKIEFGKTKSPTIDTIYKLSAGLGITAYGLVEIAKHIR